MLIARTLGLSQRAAQLAPPRTPHILVSVGLLHGLYVLWLGAIFSPDSLTYAYWSNRLVESGFAYSRLLAEAEVGFPAILYALFATLLAVLQVIFGDGWAGALVALNFAAHVALGVLLVRLAFRATGSGAAGWLALLLFLGCYDLLQWVNFVLSDATFVLIAFGVFTLAAKRVLRETKNWGRVALPAAAGIFYRPTGIVLVPDLLIAWYLSRRPAGLPPRRLLSACLLSAMAALVLFAWLVADTDRWHFPVLARSFEIVARGYAAGEVVSARFETYHSPPTALFDYVLISADRFLHFFALGAADYSVPHWLVSAGFLVPCYCLAGWLIVALWRKDTLFAAPERNMFAVASGAILAYACFHALVQIDFDWRYRVPVLPHLILLAAGGFSDILRRVARRPAEHPLPMQEGGINNNRDRRRGS